MECILLAGGTPAPGDSLYPHTRGAPKAMLPLAGRPMISWVIEALCASTRVGRVLVVGVDGTSGAGSRGPAPGAAETLAAEWRDQPVEVVPGGGSFVDNLYAGVAALQEGGPALYCGSDIPLLSGAMVDRFVDVGWREGIDIGAGLVSRAAILDRFPGAEDLWLRLREGRFIAADLAVFDPLAAADVRPHLEVLAPQRKSAVRQAWYVGLPLLIRYLTRRLTIVQFEREIRRRFGLRCAIQQVADPELGLDVDGAAALALCESALRETALSRGEGRNENNAG
jgi:GTP:adenosylcobinamide-phosphate guanylyltransferase